ncbi:hypothetical protein [Nannocystis punicea]|uniref:Uncharacterized protein n=1 Tax=Nannocystis punicea TaxID=2995304 RepID=A0ABY7HIS4_9BACT|nr:hypothetical protein [Nannocystis poenicansa]WAS99224.1 hypothetical protein O0S08_24105 [Nannocystis poenicansa]
MTRSRLYILGFAAVLACGESGAPTTDSTTDVTTTGTATATATATATTDAPTTGTTTGPDPTTSPATTDLPTGGSMGGTDTASGTTDPAGSTTDDSEGSGGGGEGSGMACAKWYDAFVDSYRPQCECQVSLGMYDSVDECLAATVPPQSCTCEIFAQSPETADQLECYEKAAQDKAECLSGLGLCAPQPMLKLCDDLQLTSLLLCGNPPKEICDAITMMCEDAPLLICLF